MWRNTATRSEFEVRVALRNEGTVSIDRVRGDLFVVDPAEALTYEERNVLLFSAETAGAALAPGATYEVPYGEGRIVFGQRAGRPHAARVEITSVD